MQALEFQDRSLSNSWSSNLCIGNVQNGHPLYQNELIMSAKVAVFAALAVDWIIN